MRAMIETKNGRMPAMIHDGPHILNRPIARLLFGLTACLFLHGGMAAAQEAVTVQEILTDPRAVPLAANHAARDSPPRPAARSL
jgi:hypothetical protein